MLSLVDVERGQGGFVDLSVVIRADGTVANVRVIGETPQGYGFAAAALKALPGWRFDARLVDGKPVDAPARIRVSFVLK